MTGAETPQPWSNGRYELFNVHCCCAGRNLLCHYSNSRG